MKTGIPSALIAILLMMTILPMVRTGSDSDTGEDWLLYDEISLGMTIPPGGTAEAILSPDGVSMPRSWPVQTPEVRAALSAAPEWLRHDLSVAFDRLDEEHRTMYADLIVGSPDPNWTDEIAFVVAHSNVPTLTDQYFFPELLYDNARSIYETDPLLDFVRIVEEDDHTTVAYIDGKGDEVVVPRDIYYWSIVHPKLGDELPTYVDPEYNYTTDPPFDRNYGTPPPTGVFWRDHLLDHNKTGKPLLKERLGGAKTIREAISAINYWVDRSMIFTSDTERPVQPVRIYEKGKGRCGEYQDMRSAAARIALIPVVATSNPAEDHVWNEFWDGEWIHWDGTVDNPRMYENGWGKTLSTVWNVRGDGHSWTVTERYSDVATLTVTVLDANGLPVDGATVDLLTENFYNQDMKTTTASSATSFDGNVTFTIGDDRNYWIRADGGSLGSYPVPPLPPAEIITGSVAGTFYNRTVSLPRAADELRVTSKTSVAGPVDAMLRITVDVASHTTIGRSSNSGGPYYENGSDGNVQLFILDPEQQNLHSRGLPFQAYNLTGRVGDASIDFWFPEAGTHHLYLYNGYSQSTYETVNVTIQLLRLRQLTVRSPSEGSNVELGSDLEVRGVFHSPYRNTSVMISADGSDWVPAITSDRNWWSTMDTTGLGIGPVTLRVRALDDIGTLETSVRVLIDDSTLPFVAMETSSETYGIGEPILLSGTASDLSGIAELHVGFDPDPMAEIAASIDPQGEWSHYIATDGLAPGTIDLIAVAVDGQENQALASARVTLVESDPPEIGIDPGIDGSLHALGDRVIISGRTYDASGITSLRLVVGEKRSDMTSSIAEDGTFSYAWDTRGYGDGWQDLTVEVLDEHGSGNAIGFRVLLDGVDPGLALDDRPTLIGPGQGLTVSGKVTDQNGIARLSYSIDRGSILDLTPPSGSGRFIFDIDTGGWAPGIHRMDVMAWDRAGNDVSSSFEVMFDPDPPVISLDPVPGIVLVGDPLTISGSIAEDNGIATVTMTLRGMDSDLMPAINGTVFLSVRDTTRETTGELAVTISASDTAGNLGTATVSTRLVDLGTDTDGDGMPDWWEHRFGLDPDSRGTDLDTDGDGSTDLDEYLGDDGMPGNDDWSDPTDSGSKPSDIEERPIPLALLVFLSASALAIVCSFAIYLIIRIRRTT